MSCWRVVRTEAPAVPALALADVKAHLRVDHDEEDALITALAAAAVAHVDGPGGWLGRALIRQQITMQGDGFEERIRLRYPPLMEMESVAYVDVAGDAQQLVEDEDWRVISGGQDGPSWLLPAEGSRWPATQWRPDAVTIVYRAGYGDTAAAVPDDIRAALLLLVGHWHMNREAVVTGTIATRLPLASEALLTPKRIWF